MRSSDSASRTSSASGASRCWLPSHREYRNLAGMGLITTLQGLGGNGPPTSDLRAGLDVEDLDAGADQLLQLVGAADEGREGPEVHGHDGLDAQQLDRLGGALGAHRVVVDDREEGGCERQRMSGQWHVAEDA